LIIPGSGIQLFVEPGGCAKVTCLAECYVEVNYVAEMNIRPGTKRLLLNLLAAILFNTLTFAQESTVKINRSGKAFSELKHAWTAQWITHPAESTLDAGKFLFRRTFELDQAPEKFIIHISADNRYRLYINGEYRLAGPSSSDINHYRYATLDIAGNLKAGKNIIAVEVVNFGEFRKVATMTFQTAFILQGDKDNPVDINTSKASDWRVVRDFGFAVIPFVSDSLRGYYAAGPGERLIANRHPWDWQQVDFDASKWLKPRAATVEFAVGRGFLYGSTWFLVPRTIPFMEETQQRFGAISRSEGMPVVENFIRGTGSLTIPPNKRVKILIDQTHHTIGHPVIHYAQGRGSQIKITYAEALYDKNWKKGHRDEVKGKHILGYYDIVEPDGGANRTFKPIGQRTYRFIQLEIKTAAEPLTIDDYYGVYTAYPFKEKAKFVTDNKILTEIWNTAWLTLRNSAVEGFIDPYYEQLQYIGDTRIEALVSISVDGDDRLMRQAIEMFDNSRLPNGLTASRYPAYIVQIIPTYSLLWINMIHDFYMYKADDEFVERFVPGMKTVLEWWLNKVDSTGMPTGMEWWNFTDWSPGFHNGIPDGADDGYSASVALQLVKTLQYAKEMFSDLGFPVEAEKYALFEEMIRKSVIKRCYDSEAGMIAETPGKEKFSQHSNIMAILTDAVPPAEQQALMQKILDDKSLIQTTIYYKFYLFNALHKVGMGDLYTGLLENWTNQLDQGLTTFAETDINPRSECHAWSASPNFHFLKIIAGIYPGRKHFEQIVVAPYFGELSSVQASMPHPKGTIDVELNKDGDQVRGVINIPPGTSGVFRWDGKEIKLSAGENYIK
jgi:hypothetical protein